MPFSSWNTKFGLKSCVMSERKFCGESILHYRLNAQNIGEGVHFLGPPPPYQG